MNHFSYDVMRKERVRSLQNEGMRSQAFYRSMAPKLSLRRGSPKLIFAILGALGILGLLVR
ncbi:MAG TPA: hypothetical protein VFG81_21420 [Anaerolineales bacterium]|jgi:hypothetical protein|nr:hypothetical protein [Anaerolineales bacterium]